MIDQNDQNFSFLSICNVSYRFWKTVTVRWGKAKSKSMKIEPYLSTWSRLAFDRPLRRVCGSETVARQIGLRNNPERSKKILPVFSKDVAVSDLMLTWRASIARLIMQDEPTVYSLANTKTPVSIDHHFKLMKYLYLHRSKQFGPWVVRTTTPTSQQTMHDQDPSIILQISSLRLLPHLDIQSLYQNK